MVLNGEKLCTFKKVTSNQATETIDLSKYSKCIKSNNQLRFDLIPMVDKIQQDIDAVKFEFKAANVLDCENWINVINETIEYSSSKKNKNNHKEKQAKEEEKENENENRNELETAAVDEKQDLETDEKKEQEIAIEVEISMGAVDWQKKIKFDTHARDNVSVEHFRQLGADLAILNNISDNSKQLDQRKDFINTFSNHGGFKDLFQRLEINNTDDNNNNNSNDYHKEILEILIAFCESKEGLDEIINLNEWKEKKFGKILLNKLSHTKSAEIKRLLLQLVIMFLEHSNSTTNDSTSNIFSNGKYLCDYMIVTFCDTIFLFAFGFLVCFLIFRAVLR